MLILDQRFQITPDVLYRLVEELLRVDAERHFLAMVELYAERAQDNRFTVRFYDRPIGHVLIDQKGKYIYRVRVVLDPDKEQNENAGAIMHSLADGIKAHVLHVAGGGSLPDNVSLEEVETLSFDLEQLRKHYMDFSPKTAQDILRLIPEAHKQAMSDLEPWSRKIISKLKGLSGGTISRHLRALYSEGLRTVEGIELPYSPKPGTNISKPGTTTRTKNRHRVK